jgi:hypothetical protein
MSNIYRPERLCGSFRSSVQLGDDETDSYTLVRIYLQLGPLLPLDQPIGQIIVRALATFREYGSSSM